MPSPDRPATDIMNTDIQREKQYEDVDLATLIANNEPLLKAEQRIIYNRLNLAKVRLQQNMQLHRQKLLPLF
jgi:hypothetical protein